MTSRPTAVSITTGRCPDRLSPPRACRILLIDEDVPERAHLAAHLRSSGFAVSVTPMELLNGGTPVPITDVIILAGSPPTKSPEWGVRMARRGYAGPLIVLVPRQSHADLESLDAGADVCLERSVGPNVVIAYILALSRRYGATRRTPDNRELKCIDRPALFEHRRLPTFTQLLRPLFRVPRFRSRSREASAFDARLDGVLLQDRTQPLARFASRRITEDHKPAGHLGRAKYY